MSIEASVVAYVVQKDIVLLPKTLKAANKEGVDYAWYRISTGNYLCTHGDKSYVINVDGDKVGCSCPSMAYHCKGNDACKHIAVFMGLPTLPTTTVPAGLAMELIAAGWSGEPGALTPPEGNESPVAPEIKDEGTKATSDEDGEDNEGGDPTPPDADKKPVPPEPKLDEATQKNIENEVNDMKDTGKDKIEITAQMQRVITDAESFDAKDIDPAYIAEKLELLTVRHKVHAAEAERSVVSMILRQQGLKRPDTKDAPNQLMAVGLIESGGRWCNLRVKVVDLWDSTADSIRQVGLVGDETGTTKFVSWEKSDLPELEKDKCYAIENVVTDEYDGRFSVKFTKNSKIQEIDEEIDVGFTTVEFTGVLVDIQKGSGLIKRCPTCNRALVKGACAEHGNVDGQHDLRIKGVLDNGLTTVPALFNADRTEQLTGIDLPAAIAIAQEALDMTEVANKMIEMLVSKEFVVTGSDLGGTILVESVREITGTVSQEDVDALLAEV